MKKPSDRAGGFGQGFSEWMDSRESLESMEALDWVFNALDGTRVDPSILGFISLDLTTEALASSIRPITA